MVKCPRCGSRANATGKEWEYAIYWVKQYMCANCKKMFMEYYREGKLNHTIPTPSLELKIMEYLKKHGSVNEKEIANAFNLTVQNVLDALIELKRKGKVRLASE